MTPFHRLARRDSGAIARRLENHRKGFVAAPGGAHHYVPRAWFPVRKVFPFDRPLALRLSSRTFERDVLTRLAHMKFTPDVISLQNPIFYPLAARLSSPRVRRAALPSSPLVLHFRMEDLLEGFPDMPASILHCEKEAIENADLVSITSSQLAFKLRGRNENKVLLLPNGVDVEHFEKPQPRPEAYSGIESPIALYVGALRSWFDWDLFEKVAKARPGVQFVLLSPHEPDPIARDLPNCTWIPGVPYEQVPAYYQHAAVGLIPFKDSPLVRAVSPIKMFECLAAGTPVVATDWAELRDLKAPIALARGADEFAKAVLAALGQSADSRYRPFLADHSWDANVDALLERIERARRDKGQQNSEA